MVVMMTPMLCLPGITSRASAPMINLMSTAPVMVPIAA